ncbi:MAG: glycoside hydrolase family 3 C-terminal domain-containing protein [Lachnospiraceae bacterium]
MRDIKKIVSEMTLEEKAGMCSGADFWNLKGIERLGIPSVMVTDGPHGLRKQQGGSDHLGINESVQAVCFPAACATAASFDEDLLEEMGTALGSECRAENVSVLLGPAVNIKRSPLCGRNFEYFSEDPYLTGKLAAAQIRGVQSQDVGTSMKHFAANNQEYRRMSVSAEMTEQTLREIYLTGFEIAVKEAKPWTLMCSYNRLNGTYCSDNKKLLTGILRDEWGFDGYVMSDWGAVDNHVKGIEAGLELQMPGAGPETDEKVIRAAKEGTLPESVLDRAVERILTKVFAYSDSEKTAVFDRAKDHEIAVKVAKECAVLLKNEGILPLSENKKVLYIGDFAKKPRYQGGGSSHINPYKVSSALNSAEEKARNVTYLNGFSEQAEEAEYIRAEEAAKEADVVVIFAGLPDSFESEGYDREHMRLPQCQNQLIERIAKVQKNTVVVLHNGSPVEMPWADAVSAILEMYLGGEGVGEATDALLFGEANPCGKLPETFPKRLEDNPSFLNFPGDGELVRYAEGIYVGYRYYEKTDRKVRFPFGHGLSYTGFAYHNLRFSSDKMKKGESVEVSVDITNTGKYAGKEIVQLYISDCTGNKNRPVKELKAFAKTELAPGETKTVTMTINARSLSWYSEKLGDWYAAPGQYEILIGSSSADIRLQGEILFETSDVLPLVIDQNTPLGMLMGNPSVIALLKSFAEALDSGDAQEAALNAEMMERMMAEMPLRAIRNFGQITEKQMQDILETIRQMF